VWKFLSVKAILGQPSYLIDLGDCDCDSEVKVQTDQRLDVGVDGLASDDAKAYSGVAEQRKHFFQQVGLIHGDGFPK
jgi:hypothetical protein